MSSSVDVIPQLREQSNATNLATLQKKDAQVTRLLFTAKHCVLYHLSPATGKVEPQDVTGPLFLVERRSAPFYELIILNRKSITDWKHAVSAQMGSAIEVQDKYLHFQASASVVITLWFHEEPECIALLDMLKRVCSHISTQPPHGPIQPFPMPAQTLASQPKAVSAPHMYNNNTSQQSSQYKQPHPQQPPPSASPAPAVLPTPPLPKTYASPYAPPPPVEYNVALPSVKNEKELAQRLNGFLNNLVSTDQQHTKAYEQELRDVEAKKRDNARRFQEEERRRQEHEARLAQEERKKRQQASSSSSSVTSPPPASAPQPTQLSAEQLSMLSKFSSATNLAPPAQLVTPMLATPAAISQPQPQQPLAPADAASELERNLAATKARKAARAAAASGSAPVAAPAPASSLPASLLFAAAQSQAPMPSMSGSPAMRPQQHQPMLSATSSPLMQPAATAPSTDIHPLLAMLNQSVAQQAAATPSPLMQSPQPSYSSPYAVTSSAAVTTTSAPTLLAPSHFLTSASLSSQPAPAAAAPSAAAPSPFLTPQSLLATMQAPVQAQQAPAASPAVMTRAAFQSYVLSLCNDPATLDWLYSRYLSRPNSHPFA